MEFSPEVVQSLRILGLPSDATSDEVRSAFRRLARTYHPDVAGRHYSHKFEQITKAYALLKDLPLTTPSLKGASDLPAGAAGGIRRGFFRRVLRGVLDKPSAWYSRRAERAAAKEAEKNAVQERRWRADSEAREKIQQEREVRAEAILKRGERLIDGVMSRMERETLSVGVQGLTSRLASDMCQIRHLALERLGELANQPEIFNALSDLLREREIDEKTARLVSSLPLSPENHGRLARALAVRAAHMPDALLSYLLRLHNPGAADPELWETYLGHAEARGISLIMRKWPSENFVSEPVLCRLISSDDESVLITTLSAMKQRSVPCPAVGRERLNAHLSHHNIAVRVWAKALLNIA